MSKCPKCGCEFHETPFATLVEDKNIPSDTIVFADFDTRPMYGDMIPEWYDGQWWNDWGAYCKRKRELEGEDATEGR